MKQLKEMDIDTPTRKKLVELCQAMHVQVGRNCFGPGCFHTSMAYGARCLVTCSVWSSAAPSCGARS